MKKKQNAEMIYKENYPQAIKIQVLIFFDCMWIISRHFSWNFVSFKVEGINFISFFKVFKDIS